MIVQHLAHRLRRWLNLKSTSGECFMFTIENNTGIIYLAICEMLQNHHVLHVCYAFMVFRVALVMVYDAGGVCC